MDRQIVYSGAIPLETDLLNTNKYAMIGLAKLASAMMGSNTYVHGLACTASSPASMVVNVAAGQIYSLQNVDGTAYSSLAADTTHSILKQGIVMDATQFTLTAPSTSGYSVNYLIQVTYTDTDSGSTVLPYYNASNPSVAWSGPNNSGSAQNTVRSGVCTVALKAGVAATTGTQTTPSPDTGYTGLYVITVAQGATTVTTSNISVFPNAPILNSGGIYDSFQRNTAIYGADSGTANSYVLNLNPKVLSLSDGTEVIFKAGNANTGASTLNVCALGAYPIISKSGAVLIANQIVANGLVKVRWSTTAVSWIMLDSTGTFQTVPTAAAGTATTQAASTAFVGNAITAATGRLIKTTVFASSGTFTPQANTVKIRVRGVGTGGNGAGGNATSSTTCAACGGGAGGGYAEAWYSTFASSILVTIGAIGAVTTGAGNSGGSSSFGSLMVIPGGGGGVFTSNSTTAAFAEASGGGRSTPTLSGQDSGIIVPGQVGETGKVYSGYSSSGRGGHSPLGSGGPVAVAGSGTAAAGNGGAGYGGGGGGAAVSYSSAATNGGLASTGVFIVEEYA